MRRSGDGANLNLLNKTSNRTFNRSRRSSRFTRTSLISFRANAVEARQPGGRAGQCRALKVVHEDIAADPPIEQSHASRAARGYRDNINGFYSKRRRK